MKKFFRLGLLAIVLVIGTMVVRCGEDSTSNSDPKKITITGINGTFAEVRLFDATAELIASGDGKITDRSATIPLIKHGYGKPWTGSDSYYLLLRVWAGGNSGGSREGTLAGSAYYYTNGKTFEELGLSDKFSDAEMIAKLPKYRISSTTSTMSLTQFANSNPNEITITGLAGKDGYSARIFLRDATGARVVWGKGTISGNSITFPLWKWPPGDIDKSWTGNGSYAIQFYILSIPTEDYYYTGGRTLDQIGISYPDFEKLPKYRFLSATSTLDLDQFILAD